MGFQKMPRSAIQHLYLGRLFASDGQTDGQTDGRRANFLERYDFNNHPFGVDNCVSHGMCKLRNRWAVFSLILRPTPTPKVPPTPTHLPTSSPTYPPPHPPTHPNHFLSYKGNLDISSTLESKTGHTALGLAAMVTVLLTKTNNISS